MLHLEFLVERLSAQRQPSDSQDAGEHGASLVEYSLLVALIAVVCVGAVSMFGGELNNSIGSAGSSIN
ncbi:MAG: Flp family type IVb pilin [Acidimicrobiales bacterium]